MVNVVVVAVWDHYLRVRWMHTMVLVTLVTVDKMLCAVQSQHVRQANICITDSKDMLSRFSNANNVPQEDTGLLRDFARLLAQVCVEKVITVLLDLFPTKHFLVEVRNFIVRKVPHGQSLQQRGDIH